MTAPTFQDVCALIGQTHPGVVPNILAVYPWGSRIYQCATPTSDYDYIVVVADDVLPRPDITFVKPNGLNAIDKRFAVLEDSLINATLISFFDWRVCVLQHHHECLEILYTDPALFLFESAKLVLFRANFVLDKDLLRRTAAWESKRRFTRAVFPARDEMRRGKKDLVHALRYLLFALQIFENDRIVDFTAANGLYKEIVLNTDDIKTEEDFKRLMVKWEPKRYELAHQLGDARVSRRFYSRTDTEAYFMNIVRQKDRVDQHKLDDETLKFSSTPLPDLPRAPHLQIIYNEILSHNSLWDLQATHPIDWLRDMKDPTLLLLMPQRAYNGPMTPFLSAIWNGVVLLQPTSPSEHLKVLAQGPSYMDSHRSLSSTALQTWEERLSTPTAIQDYYLEEHVDGTIVKLYYYQGEWRLSTRLESTHPRLPLSYLAINNVDSEISLSNAFWKTWKDKNYSLPTAEEENVCFTFELKVNVHRYIVYYEHDDICLIHAQDMNSGQVLDHRELAKAHGWALPRLYNDELLTQAQNVEALAALVDDFNPLLTKGLILKSKSSQTEAITIKNMIYVNIRYGTDFSNIGMLNMRAEADRKLLLEQAVFNLGPRYLEAFPFWAPTFNLVAGVYREFCAYLDKEYMPHRRKEKANFAQGVMQFRFVNTLYRMRQGNFPAAAEMFMLMGTKAKYFHMPWKEYLKKIAPLGSQVLKLLQDEVKHESED